MEILTLKSFVWFCSKVELINVVAYYQLNFPTLDCPSRRFGRLPKDAEGAAPAFPRRADARPPEARMAPPRELVGLDPRGQRGGSGGAIKHVVQLGFKSVGGNGN